MAEPDGYAIKPLTADTWDAFAELAVSATSDQLVIPALWQLPTMAVAMPAMTMLGGLAAVHWLRRRARRPEALASGGS